MNKKIITILKNMDIKNKTILDTSSEIGGEYGLNDISTALKEMRTREKVKPKNEFGYCGINREANPCGDASEY